MMSSIAKIYMKIFLAQFLHHFFLAVWEWSALAGTSSDVRSRIHLHSSLSAAAANTVFAAAAVATVATAKTVTTSTKQQ